MISKIITFSGVTFLLGACAAAFMFSGSYYDCVKERNDQAKFISEYKIMMETIFNHGGEYE